MPLHQEKGERLAVWQLISLRECFYQHRHFQEVSFSPRCSFLGIMNKLCDASEGGVRIAHGYTETDVVSECTTLATTTQAGGLLGSCRANVSPEHWNRIH